MGLCLGVNAVMSAVNRELHNSSAALQWLNVLALWGIAIALLVRERLVLGIWVYASLHFTVINAVEDYALFPGGRRRNWMTLPLLSYLSLVASITFFVMRQRLLKRSAHGIADDKKRCDSRRGSGFRVLRFRGLEVRSLESKVLGDAVSCGWGQKRVEWKVTARMWDGMWQVLEGVGRTQVA